jgi:SAM domain (Sterile alpha motif)
MGIRRWLQSLGLERYVQAFDDNDIDAEVLARLTADDLVGLRVTSIGRRRKLLYAIAALRSSKCGRADQVAEHHRDLPAFGGEGGRCWLGCRSATRWRSRRALGSAKERSVVGEAPNLAARLAARLKALAEPNAVVIAAGTRRLVGDLFEDRDLGAIGGPVLRASTAEQFHDCKKHIIAYIIRGEQTAKLV